MISRTLLTYCLALAGTYLLIISILLDLLGRKLRVNEGIPQQMLESSGVSWSMMQFLIELLFYVVIPSLIFGFFYFVMPFSGIRAGLGAALFAFTIGSTPSVMVMTVRIKLPMPFVLYHLLAHLLKLGGCMGIIGYLYSI